MKIKVGNAPRGKNQETHEEEIPWFFSEKTENNVHVSDAAIIWIKTAE